VAAALPSRSLDGVTVAINDSQAGEVYTSPWFWLALAGILVVERLLPVRPGQRVFSSAFRHDALYFLLTGATRVTVLALYVWALKAVYARYLGFLTIDAVAAWPGPARLGAAILLTDFLAWFHHWLRHKVPLFWRFHAIHHSQRELNFFTDVRYHPVEYAVTQTVQFLPLLMFQNAFPVGVAYSFAHQAYTKLYHANVRLSLGPLRYLLVTPQSHRVHHSIRPEHTDRNFGVIFSIWDRLFGTQCHDARTYPETGIGDERFPAEGSCAPRAHLGVLWRQLAYPFQGLVAGRR
jgi:sterol desaturase/sphingolipid hydroxylase (fatty acid hydroxylase superfamily)